MPCLSALQLKNSNLPSVFRVQCDFKKFDPYRPQNTLEDDSKVGTAFIIHARHRAVLLATAYHVVSQSIRITVSSSLLPDGQEHEVHLIGMNPLLDIALLKLDDENGCLKGREISMANEPLDHTGSPLKVVGYAGAFLSHSTTTGTVSGRTATRVQTEAVINRGNSGGPVLNEDGFLVGIVTSGIDTMQNTNFFTGLREIRASFARIYNQYKTAGPSPVVDLGYQWNATFQAVDGKAADRCGALVTGVSYPKQTGLKKGDIVVSVQSPHGVEEQLPVDAKMRVQHTASWKSDRLAFQTLPDMSMSGKKVIPWNVVVYREGKEVNVEVILSPSSLESRHIFPECRTDLKYVALGGMTFMNLSSSHEDLFYRLHGDLPEVEVDSLPVITHVASGCPFENARVGEVPVGMEFSDGKSFGVKSLRDMGNLVERRNAIPVRIFFRSGRRVGATKEAILHFEGPLKGEKRGYHLVTFPKSARI